MKRIKVGFEHPFFIYKFKLQLLLFENANMLGFDIQKINKQFLSILGDLILTAEERYILESLSIGFKSTFITSFENSIQSRRQVDYLGDTAEAQTIYAVKLIKGHKSQSIITRTRQIYLFMGKGSPETEKSRKMLLDNKIFENLSQMVDQFQGSEENNKNSCHLFASFLLTSIKILLSQASVLNRQMQPIVNITSKMIIECWMYLAKFYDFTYLTSIYEIICEIIMKLLCAYGPTGWIYRSHNIHQSTSYSILLLLIQSLKEENRNFKIKVDSIKILCTILQKSQAVVNDLLFFITECINLKINLRLQNFTHSLRLQRYSIHNTIYWNLPKDLTDLTKKIIRFNEKTISETNWKSEHENGKEKLKILNEEFVKFRSGKIGIKRQGQKKPERESLRGSGKMVKSERDRIRKESFLMTNFDEIKLKYEEGLINEEGKEGESADDHQSRPGQQERKNIIRVGELEKKIEELEIIIAEFVDVKKKFIRQNILKIHTVLNFHIQLKETNIVSANQNFFQIETKSLPSIQSNLDLTQNFLPPPPPPPPFTLDLNQIRNSLKSSRKSKQFSLPSLPPPPLFNSNSELSIPPPPPLLPPVLLTPPPALSNIFDKKAAQKKDVKTIHWMPIQISKVKDSFWQRNENVQFDEKGLKDFFAKRQTIQAPKIMIAASKQKKSLLKPERAKNIEIILKKTRIDVKLIPKAIQQIDQQALREENVDSLLNTMPSAEEIEAYFDVELEDPEEWTKADYYYKLISKIPGYFQLLRALRFKFEFDLLHKVTIFKLNQFQEFFLDLQKDLFFRSFLSHLLSIGNFMNTDTSRGNAFGFKLLSIEKSYLLLGEDKKTSLFQYIVQTMYQKNIKLKEKKSYTPKKITPIEILKDDLKEMARQCQNVQDCLLKSKEDDFRTPEVFLSFYIDCRQKVSLLDQKYKSIMATFHRVRDYFCEQGESEQITKIVNDFRAKLLQLINSKKIQIAK